MLVFRSCPAAAYTTFDMKLPKESGAGLLANEEHLHAALISSVMPYHLRWADKCIWLVLRVFARCCLAKAHG